MRVSKICSISLILCFLVPMTASRASAPPPESRADLSPVSRIAKEDGAKQSSIKFRHGDCFWLPAMALTAGWSADQVPQLIQISLRESGCCPNRKGGDKVDKNCNITGVSEWNHRSDTGVLQLNGINYNAKRNPTAPICLQMDVCTQEPLLDPLTNLRAGKVLFDYWQESAGDGWIPWRPVQKGS